jgi:hypothetical protein
MAHKNWTVSEVIGSVGDFEMAGERNDWSDWRDMGRDRCVARHRGHGDGFDLRVGATLRSYGIVLFT